MSSTSMDHPDELPVATASSVPLNGLAPAPTQGTTPRSRPYPINAASLPPHQPALIRTSLIAVPKRGRVLAAKSLVPEAAISLESRVLDPC